MIVSCGEALIDMLPRDIAGEGQGYLPVVGGAIYNTAITLGRLGEKAGFFTGLSNDMFGQQIEQSLAQAHVDSAFCVKSDLPTTLAFVKLSDGRAEYAFMDENSAGRMLSTRDLPHFSDDVSALHFGAISLVAEPCGSTYEALMAREAAQRVISFDPNIRPGFIRDARGHRARIDRMFRLADIVKLSDEDLHWLAPGAEIAPSVQSIMALGVSVILLTRGHLGVDIFTPAGQFHVAAKPVTVVDSVGAGDSFNGGFLAGLRRGNMLSKVALQQISPAGLRDAVELAVKVAAVTVSRAGANPPWADELDP